MTVSETGKRFMTAVLAVVVLGGAAIAAAGDQQHNGGGSGHEHGPGPDAMFGAGFFGGDIARMGDQLGLSAEQRQSIKGILDAARPQMQAMRESMRTNAEKLRGTQPDDPNYATVVAQVSQSAAELASKLVTDSSQVRSQVYGLLNKEQKAKLPQIEAQMRDETRQRFQRHRPPASAPSSGDSTPST
jgi:Spy/CpxP family protein refolding chaperone